MTSSLTQVVTAVLLTPDALSTSDRTTQRLLDAAVTEAAAVGVKRLTVEDVVRRAGVSRMTAYRRFPRRDDLVDALVQRETTRFLAAVAAGIESADDPGDGVVEAFLAAVRFCRSHPILRRAPHSESPSGTDTAALLPIGTDFIAHRINAGRDGPVSQEIRWVADVFARLFLTFISVPPTEPDFDDDAALRRYAAEVLTPMVRRVR